MARLMQFNELLQLLDSPSLAPAEKFPLVVITEHIARKQMLVIESAPKFSYKALYRYSYPLKLTCKRQNN